MRFTSLLAITLLFAAGNVYAQADDEEHLIDHEEEAADKKAEPMEKAKTKTCSSVKECGEVVDPPYYYDWTYKPSGLYTINNIFLLQATAISVIYAGETYQQYVKTTGTDPSLDKLSDLMRSPTDTRLKSL